jgi:hypothetical protein
VADSKPGGEKLEDMEKVENLEKFDTHVHAARVNIATLNNNAVHLHEQYTTMYIIPYIIVRPSF